MLLQRGEIQRSRGMLASTYLASSAFLLCLGSGPAYAASAAEAANRAAEAASKAAKAAEASDSKAAAEAAADAAQAAADAAKAASESEAKLARQSEDSDKVPAEKSRPEEKSEKQMVSSDTENKDKKSEEQEIEAEKPVERIEGDEDQDKGVVAGIFDSDDTVYNPHQWNITEDVTIGIGGYVQGDAYTLDRSNADFGSGNMSSRTVDTDIRRAYVSLVGTVYDWNYFLVYDLANDGDNVKNGLVWAWVGHDLGPGQIALGQHWDYSSREEPVAAKNLMFLERNMVSGSHGINGMRDHNQGIFYDLSQSYGDGNNNIFWGAGLYTLNDTITGRTHAGYGASTTIEWAPIVKDRRWMQMGAAFTYDSGHNKNDNDNDFQSFANTYTGAHGPTQILAKYDEPDIRQVNANIMGSYEGLFLMGEYARAHYEQSGEPHNTVQAYSLSASYWLTGESTGFDKKVASYSTPKPIHDYGAVQVAAGFDRIENTSSDGRNAGGHGCASSKGFSNGFDKNDISSCKVDQYKLALSYFTNPDLRFTAQLTKALVDLGSKHKKDDPLAFTLRTQFAF